MLFAICAGLVLIVCLPLLHFYPPSWFWVQTAMDVTAAASRIYLWGFFILMVAILVIALLFFPQFFRYPRWRRKSRNKNECQ
jgi:membrane protein YdbS with pleckstrin-like domain